MTEVHDKAAPTPVPKEADRIENLALGSLYGDRMATNTLAQQARIILSSPPKYMDDLISQVEADRRRDHSGLGWIPQIRIENHRTLIIENDKNQQMFNANGQTSATIGEAQGTAATYGTVEQGRPQAPDHMLKPQSKAVADKAHELEEQAKLSLWGGVQAAGQIADTVQDVKRNPDLMDSLNNQFEYDRFHDKSVPPMQFTDRGNMEAALTITNPDAGLDWQKFLFYGEVKTDIGDLLDGHQVHVIPTFPYGGSHRQGDDDVFR